MAKQIVLAKKQLTPNQFGLNMTPVDAATLLRKVNATLKTMHTGGKMSKGVFTICDEIMKQSNKGLKSFNIPFDSWVTFQEVGIIVSDFGANCSINIRNAINSFSFTTVCM